jgi:hypothetical protein
VPAAALVPRPSALVGQTFSRVSRRDRSVWPSFVVSKEDLLAVGLTAKPLN